MKTKKSLHVHIAHVHTVFCFCIFPLEQVGIKFTKAEVEIQPENLCIPSALRILDKKRRFGM